MKEKYKLASVKSSHFDFGGGELSSESGMLLFNEYVHKRGILELFQEQYAEDRGFFYEHKKPELLYQQVQRIIAGYTNNNVNKFLQKDPVHAQVNDKRLASASTVCRWGQGFSEKDQYAIQGIQDTLIEIYYQQVKSKRITIDIDTTYDPASDNLEGVSYNTHYGENGYSPMVAFDGDTGIPLRANLRPGNKYCSEGAESFLESLLQKLPDSGFLEEGIWFRGDSGFACPEVYEVCETRSVTYVIKLKRNDVLADLVDEYSYNNKLKPDPEETKIYYFGALYQAGSWSKPRRVVFKVIWPAGELFPTYQAIVTSDTTMGAEEIFSFYNKRAVCENWIEEGKNGFSWDHLSLKSFLANQTRFLIFFLAMTTFRLFQIETMNQEWQKKSVQTIRTHLLRVASKLVTGGRKLCFRLSSSFVFQNIFLEIYRKIQNLRWSFAISDP